MQNWTKENNKQETLDINTDISELLPENLIQGYKIDEIYLTTFSLDLDCLKEILYGLNALYLVGEGKVQVFYDKSTRNWKPASNQIISEKYLHGIDLEENGKLYAFHPKVILCKYTKENNEVRYIMVILSKNIAESNLLDTYAIAYGDVGTKETTNGKQASIFWEMVFRKGSIENQSILEELKKVEFKQNDDSCGVQFFDAKGVFNKIMDKQDLIVISPFLSDNFFTKISKNHGTIAKIVSTKNGYGKLSKKIIKPFINEKKCRLLTSKNASELHAKIYCYGEKDGTYWIIGSSNATNNGCNILEKSSNVEFNIGFKTSEEVYECFKNLLDGQYFSPFHHSDYEVYNKDSDGFDARDIYHNFIKNIKKIECLKTEASNKSYQCKITTGKEYEIKDRLVGDFWNIKDEGEYVEYIWESKVPMSSIRIRIVNENKKDEEQFREFGLSLYEYWSDDVKAELDAKCIVSYTDLLKHIQKQILAGKSRNRISLGQNKDNGSVDHKATNVNQGRNVNKIYSYESLLKLSQNKEKDDEFVDALAQVYELADQILKKDKGNIQQQNMKKLIDDLKKVEKRNE